MDRKRQVGEASSSQPPAEPPIHRNLINRRIVPTKFVDELLLEELGIRDEVFELFNNIGWEDFIHLTAHTYDELTREFFATLDIQQERVNWTVTFTIGGQNFQLSVQQIRNIFRLPHTGDTQPPRGWKYAGNKQEIWESFDHRGEPGPFHPSSSKASSLSRPAWRYIHKVFVSSVCARLDSPGNITNSELWFFDCMFKRTLVDPTYIMLDKMLACANRSSGAIAYGGYVTILAQHLNIFRGVIPYEPIPGSILVDADTLSLMDLIIKWGPPLNKWVVWWPPEIRETRLRPRYNAGQEDGDESPDYDAPDFDDNIPLDSEFFQNPPQSSNTAPPPHPDITQHLTRIETQMTGLHDQIVGVRTELAELRDQMLSDRRHIDHQYAHINERLSQFFATYPPPPPPDQSHL